MKMKKIHWNDIGNAVPSELKRVYKMNDRQLEQSIRRHMDGASPTERRQFYEKAYSLKDKR